MGSDEDLGLPPFDPYTYHRDMAVRFDKMFEIVENTIREGDTEAAIRFLKLCQDGIHTYCNGNQEREDDRNRHEAEVASRVRTIDLSELLKNHRPS